MSPHKQARAIYKAISSNETLVLAARAEFAALAVAITSANGSMQIVDSQVNGQGFTARHSSTAQDRFQVLDILISMLDAGSPGTTKTIGAFR